MTAASPPRRPQAAAVRVIAGNTRRTMSGAQFAGLRAGRRLLLDIGTGDGKHVLRAARDRPDWLVVGVDAVPGRMARASAAAARKPASGGTPNAVFVWAAAEDLPAALGPADELHVLLPWGSLLRGILGAGEEILAGLRALAAQGAPLLVTLNLHAWRPPVPEVGECPEPAAESAADQLGARYLTAGWRLEQAWHPAGPEVSALSTSWGGRLASARGDLDVLALRATAV